MQQFPTCSHASAWEHDRNAQKLHNRKTDPRDAGGQWRGRRRGCCRRVSEQARRSHPARHANRRRGRAAKGCGSSIPCRETHEAGEAIEFGSGDTYGWWRSRCQSGKNLGGMFPYIPRIPRIPLYLTTLSRPHCTTHQQFCTNTDRHRPSDTLNTEVYMGPESLYQSKVGLHGTDCWYKEVFTGISGPTLNAIGQCSLLDRRTCHSR